MKYCACVSQQYAAALRGVKKNTACSGKHRRGECWSSGQPEAAAHEEREPMKEEAPIVEMTELTRDAQGSGDKDPFLASLGERIRNLRAQRGLTRKATAQAADISERHLANLEL